MIIDYDRNEFVEWDYDALSTVECDELYNAGYVLNVQRPDYIEFYNEETFDEIVFYSPFEYDCDNATMIPHAENVLTQFQELFEYYIEEFNE